MTEMTIPAWQIVPGPNDRKVFDKQKLAELATSIREHGLRERPLLRPVSPDPDSPRYEIVFGERRVRAMRDVLKWDALPVQVREMDDRTASVLMLMENTARVNLNGMEAAVGYKARMDLFGLSANEVAKMAGVKPKDVTGALRLLNLAPEIQHMVAYGQFPENYAQRMADLDINRQRIAIQVFIRSKTAIPLERWQKVIDRLYEAQISEVMLPGFETVLQTEIVEARRVMTGKRAYTGAPLDFSLPRVVVASKAKAAHVIEGYIVDLQVGGFGREAGAVANLYNALVAMGAITLPDKPRLAQSNIEAGNGPVEFQ